MQRSITHQKSLKDFILYLLAFLIYESMSSVYLFLPPLFGVLFFYLVKALDDEDTVLIVFISLCLVIFEADKGYVLFSSIIYLFLAYKFVLPKLVQNFNCPSCLKLSYVVIPYVGFFLVNALVANIFLLEMPDINFYIIYYIFIEFLLVSLL